MKKGDVILISFPFTDLSGNKVRPALGLLGYLDNENMKDLDNGLKEIFQLK